MIFNMDTPLIISVKKGDIVATKYLFKNGANANLKNLANRSALDIAQLNHLFQIVEIFLKN